MLYRNYGFPITVVRPGNLFGRYQPKDKLIPSLIEKMKHGKTIDLTPGDQLRDFVYVSDFIDALCSILEQHDKAKGRVVNISYGKGIRIRELAEYLKKRINPNTVLNWGALPYRKNEMMNFECDIGLLNDAFGFRFHRDFYSALDEYLQIEGIKA
jgi:nucleoside-diphosphate-sugar epimerase